MVAVFYWLASLERCQRRDIAAAWGAVVIGADYVHVPKNAFPDASDIQHFYLT
jgi:hypothetical protein